MLDFLLSPFKAFFNFDIYTKATKQSFGKTLLFLVYLLFLTSIFYFAILLVKMPPLTPLLTELTNTIAQYTPDIEIKNKTITANNGEYLEIKPEGLEKKIVFDTSRTEPIYPTELANQNIAILVTAKQIYFIQEDGGFNVYDTEKMGDNVKDLSINKQVILDNQQNIVSAIKKVFYYVFSLAMPVIVVLVMIVLMVLAVVACVISQIFIGADISFADILVICCYLIAPALFLTGFISNLPVNVIWLICFVLFLVYSQFIFNRIKIQKALQNKEEK